MGRRTSWNVSDEQTGWRLDRVVATRDGVGSRRKARAVVESGKLSIDGSPCRNPAQAVLAGQRLSIDWDRPGTGKAHQRGRAAVTSAGVRILLEDEWLIAVDKPPGLLTDSASRKQSRNEDTLTDRLGRYLAPQGKQALPAHRIDRGTSGVVLFAKDTRTWEALREQFHARTPERVYLAVLEGIPRPSEGTWSDWMAWDSELLRQTASGPDEPGAVLAEAHYTVTRRLRGGRSVVEVRLVSGRRNQIRLHAQLRGHPLVGDHKYGHPGRKRGRRGHARHALHALRLGFDHPNDGRRIVVEAPLPGDLAGAAGRR